MDLGAGPGTITCDLAARVSPGQVTAVEANADAADVTRAGVAGVSAPAVSVVVSDAHHLDLPDDSFDITHAHQVLQHVADPIQVLREMARVTVPGGTIAVRDSDYAAFAWWPHDDRLDRWMSLYQKAARSNGGEPNAGRRLLAWAHSAGLRDIVASGSSWCLATPDDRAWWGGMWADRILQSALTDQLLSEGWSDQLELQAISQAWQDWADHSDGWINIFSAELLITV